MITTLPRVFYLPLENLEDRYTGHMRAVLEKMLTEMTGKYIEHAVVIAEGYDTATTIAHGQFLDAYDSNIHKAAQVKALLEEMKAGSVRDHDIVLVGDYWFPGIEAIKHTADLIGIRLYFAGWNYAGIADPHDYYTRRLGDWAWRYECLLLGLFDFLAVGSEHHRQQVEAFFAKHAAGSTHAEIDVCGLVWDYEEAMRLVGTTEHSREHDLRCKRVVFSHRFAPEKQPYEFIEDALWAVEALPNYRFVISTNRPLPKHVLDMLPECVAVCQHETKAQYYQMLAQSEVFYSSALQETFGYSFHEAIAFGCRVVIPNAASYSDVFGCSCPSWGKGVYMYNADNPEHRRLALRCACDSTVTQRPPLELTRHYAGRTEQWLRKIACQARFG